MKKVFNDKYRLTIAPGVYDIQGFGEVDLRSLSVAAADRLFSRNFPYLELLPRQEKPLAGKGSKK